MPINAKDNKGNTLLHYAVSLSKGNFNVLDALIEKGADVNAKDKYGTTPLYKFVSSRNIKDFKVIDLLVSCKAEIRGALDYALKNGDVKIELIEYLIEKGADVNAQSNNQKAPLFRAIHYNRMDLVKLLISKGADINAVDQYGNSLLHVACGIQDLWIMKFLVEEMKMNINIINESGNTVLHSALKRKSSFSIIPYLISKGADVNKVNNRNEAPIHYSCYGSNSRNDFKKIIELLLSKGADINARGMGVETILQRVVQNTQYFKFIPYLISKGADVNIKKEYSRYRTPLLHQLISRGQDRNVDAIESVTKLLLQKGVDINGKDSQGTTALYNAINKKLLTKMLLNLGADLNSKDNHGATLFLRSFRYNRRAIVDYINFLIKEGANVRDKDDCGNTALHLAVARNYSMEIIKPLIDKGLDVNAVNVYGETPLHSAMAKGNKRVINVIKLLFENGATGNVLDYSGNTPFHKLSFRFYNDRPDELINLIKLMVKNKMNINAQNDKGISIFHKSLNVSFSQKTKIFFEELLRLGADINALDYNGNTSIHQAVASLSMNKELIKFLLEKKLDINAKNLDGQTPLHLVTKLRSLRSGSIKDLVELGADINIQDNEGNTALHLTMMSVRQKSYSLVNVLKDLKADIYKVNSRGQTALHILFDSEKPTVYFDGAGVRYYSVHYMMQCLNLLIDMEVDINKKDNEGNTALHLVGKKLRNPLVVTQLLKKNADMNLKNKEGYTPLEIAVRYNSHPTILNAFLENVKNSAINYNKLFELASKYNPNPKIKKILSSLVKKNK